MSALDARIRFLAREEAAALVGAPAGVQADGDSAPTAEQMQEQITILHEHLHHAATTISGLEERIAALEKATTQTTTPARRTSRKTTDTPE
jgi:septal ring factor EnvC (AmiA/AmiB activator)